MVEIQVTPLGGGDPAKFRVVVVEADGSSSHEVSVASEDLQKYSRDGETPDGLLRRSFEFLLAHEPKESILATFELSAISRYFSDYEREITS